MILSGKNKRIDIFGAGGHARTVISLLERCEFGVEGLYDPSYVEGADELIGGVKLRGKAPSGERPVIVAYGDNLFRAKLVKEYRSMLYQHTIIDPTAIIEKDVSYGNYNVIMPGSMMNPEARIGDNNIINVGSIVAHEAVLGDNNHVSALALVCGRVTIGNNVFVGAKSIIIEKLSVCDNVIIGAGAVVIRSITQPGTYVGNPARKIR